MADNSTVENKFENGVISPGQLLRAEREKLNLTAQDIAKRIHLDIKIVEAIEADDHENMPSAIYVRGYLRSYAKIVAADAEEIIKFYNSDSPPPPEILPEVKPPTQASSNDKPVKAFTYLISLGLVLLLLIWYQSNFVVETTADNESNITTNDTNTINGVDITYDVIIHPEGWQTPVETTSEVPTDTTEVPVLTIENEALQLQTDNGEETLGILPVEEIESQTSSFITSDENSIILKLTRDSWIEVYDANDTKLFLDTGYAGEQYTINGTPPFKVKLGFSQGVTVEFNGKTFDQSPYSKNGIARFTLPDNNERW